MSAQALAEAVLALVPGTVHDGAVPALPSFPYSLVAVRHPAVTERAMSRGVLGRRVAVRVTVTGETASSVRVMSQNVADALEGARPSAAGWACSPVEQVNEREPVEDPDVTIPATGAHPIFAVLEFAFTATRTA